MVFDTCSSFKSRLATREAFHGHGRQSPDSWEHVELLKLSSAECLHLSRFQRFIGCWLVNTLVVWNFFVGEASKTGCEDLTFPVLQPRKIKKGSGRRPFIVRLKDRAENTCCLERPLSWTVIPRSATELPSAKVMKSDARSLTYILLASYPAQKMWVDSGLFL